jgi:hypothetical protein
VNEATRKPDFLIIGAQKAGTTWMWRMLNRHPGTSLPRRKELHFFGSSELYAEGLDNYLQNFDDTDPQYVTGEASTTYLSDRVAIFYNEENRLEYDESLASPPELVADALPEVKIVVSLRDPVTRAISAYRHFMRRGTLPVSRGLIKTIDEHPRLRILEMGDYARHLKPWFDTFPRERILVLVFEEDVIADPAGGISKLYEFLGLDTGFSPLGQEEKVNKSWNWTQTVANYYAGPFGRFVRKGPIAAYLARHDWLKDRAVTQDDLEYLRDFYLPSRESLEYMLQKDLGVWSYGAR